jgi:large subunit ribosomal protein L32e
MTNNVSNNMGEAKDVPIPSNLGEQTILMRVRERQKRNKPHFVRQESWRYKRVSPSWRRPRGKDSKMRLKKKGRPKSVEVGYRSPRLVRGFHPSGFKEKLVHNIKDLEKVDQNQVVRIGHTVGFAKKSKISERAKELGFRVLNIHGVGVGEPEESKETSV